MTHTRFQWLIIAMFLATAASARASDRFFGDLETVSSNKLLQLTAKRDPSAGGFVLCLTDRESSTELWRRAQTDGQGAPVQLILNDDAWVAVRDSEDVIRVYEPVTGRETISASILLQFSKEEYNRYVTSSSIGPLWAHGSHLYFVESRGAPLFVVRPWWGNRIILDIDAGKTLPRNAPEAIAVCRKSEIEWARLQLENALPTLRSGKPFPDGFIWRLDTPINILAMEHDRDSIPLLRQMAEIERVNVFDFGGLAQRSALPACRAVSMPRQHANTALRLLGEKPTRFPCNWFTDTPEVREGVPIHKLRVYLQPRQLDARDQCAARLQVGASFSDVLHVLGGPDFVYRDNPQSAWLEYDIDSDAPYTLHLGLDSDGRVSHIEHIRPPKWQTSERGLFHTDWNSGR